MVFHSDVQGVIKKGYKRKVFRADAVDNCLNN